MLEQKTVLHRVEIFPDTGRVQALFHKLVLKDGTPIGDPGYHREAFDPGDDVDAAIARANDNLTKALGCEPITADHAALLKAHCAREHTPDRVKAHREKLAAAIARRIA